MSGRVKKVMTQPIYLIYEFIQSVSSFDDFLPLSHQYLNFFIDFLIERKSFDMVV
jgi:hypothetical protein